MPHRGAGSRVLLLAAAEHKEGDFCLLCRLRRVMEEVRRGDALGQWHRSQQARGEDDRHSVGVDQVGGRHRRGKARSEEHTSELQSLMLNSYAVFCMEKKQYRTRIEK